jgi:hypothetical protein
MSARTPIEKAVDRVVAAAMVWRRALEQWKTMKGSAEFDRYDAAFDKLRRACDRLEKVKRRNRAP